MKGNGKKCGNRKCIKWNYHEDSKCINSDYPEECRLYEPIVVKIKVWACMKGVRNEMQIEVDTDAWEELSENREQSEYIYNTLMDLIEWGYEEV